ncbi:UNVERIFIED_ORG: hypothetical protein B2H93_05000, partial [Clostridium botulinum]
MKIDLGNRNVQIVSVEAKDVLTKKYKINDNTLKIGSLDYSMETDKLRTLGKNIIKINKKNKRYYTYSIMNVTFKYACKGEKDLTDEEYERVFDLKQSYELIKNKEEKKKIKELISIAERKMDKKSIRYMIYENGFNININGKLRHFVRYKRTSGSARVGKCLFIDNRYYKKMINWSFAGIKHTSNTYIDVAGIEAYISLPTSSSIDRFVLKPENILLIDDVKSVFKDTVMATKFKNEVYDKEGNIIDGDLKTEIETKEIINKIFDGESLFDESIFLTKGMKQGMIIRNKRYSKIFSRYEDKAILQSRNMFFKGIGIRTKIQKFFKDNNITSIKQLNGKTIATDISQIKLITTPSSIKYLKFGSFEEWLKIIEEEWAICKYEKPQHHIQGMVQTHYQLLNTLGMDKETMRKFLKPTIDYINLLKTDISVFKHHLKINNDVENEEDIIYKEKLDKPINNSNDLVLSMLQINDDFQYTKMCKKFRDNSIQSYIKNARHGHIFVNGNYSVLVSCPYEYLMCAIGKYKKEDSLLKPFECMSSKFEAGEEILGVRSPEPTMSNITILKNTYNELIDKYFYSKSKEIVFISPVGNNIMELLSSCDFDGDTLLLTNNNYLVEYAKKLSETIQIDGKVVKRFLVSTDFTPKSSIKRKYCWEDLADTDIKCSSNKIGEIINLAQMLNSLYWDKKHKGVSEKELLNLYMDISNLNILSCIEIDRAKKISPVNAKRELDKIRKKHNLGKDKISRNKEKKEVGIRPKFFKYLDGGKDYKFNWFETGMDYLEKILDEDIVKNDSYDNIIELKKLLININVDKQSKRTVNYIKNLFIDMKNKQNTIWNKDCKYTIKKEYFNNVYLETLNKISNCKINECVVYEILNRISNSYKNGNVKEWRNIGMKILKLLYLYNS